TPSFRGATKWRAALRDAPPAQRRGRSSGRGPHAEERTKCASRSTGSLAPLGPRNDEALSLRRRSKVPRHIVCLTFDFDTQSGFIARGMTTPTPLSRGEFGLIGARRILALLKAHGLRATWFIPGFTIESHPGACADVVEHGHEVAHHSWAHVPPAQQTREEEEADLILANDCVERLTGRNARGYRSPSWDLSASTIELLLAHGFFYDSSLMGGDYWPYRVRRGDRAELGKPFEFGEETSLIEMPISWSLDDYPHFEFVRTPTSVLPGLQSAQ